MFDIASDWQKVIDVERKAILKNGKYQSLQAIEPDAILTRPIVGIFVSSKTANVNWYNAGNIYQALEVPFGAAGAAQAESFRIVLERYQVYRFNLFGKPSDYRYLLSYVPPRYFKDVRLEVWEYQGTSQGISIDDIYPLLRQSIQQLNKANAAIKKIQDKLNKQQ